MEKIIGILSLINSKAADDSSKGNIVFNQIKQESNNYDGTLILDFAGIELVNTAFLNNAIGKIFDKTVFDMSKNGVKIRNMKKSMMDLLKESINEARKKYE